MKRSDHPRLIGLTGAARKAERQKIRREKWVASGLTTRGATRTRQRWAFNKHVGRRVRHRLQVRSYYVKNYEAGLTAKGTPRKKVRESFPATHFGFASPLTDKDLAWRRLRATMNIVHPAETILERADDHEPATL